MKIGTLKPGKVGLVIQEESGNIVQIGLTKEQSNMLQSFLSVMSQSEKLVLMSEEYDLILKSKLYKNVKR